MLVHRFGVDQQLSYRFGSGPYGTDDPFAKVVGVDEEQWRIQPEDHQTGNRFGVG